MNASYIEVYNKYLEFKKPNISEGSFKTLEKLRDKIKKYEQAKKKVLHLSDMTVEWFQHFIKGLTNGKYGKCTNGTLKLYVICINGFLNHCEVFGYMVNRDYIKFKEYMKAYKVPKFNRPIITDEELANLWKHKGYHRLNDVFVPLTNYNEKVRDLFVFQTQVGFRWGDISRLTRGDIITNNGKYYVNNFNTEKRKVNVSVQLNDLAMLIIRKYSKRFDKLSAKTVVFKDVPDCSNANHKLKWVAKKAGIARKVEVQKGRLDKVKKVKLPLSKVISTHIARAKFATDWIVAGKDIYKLKIILGHASIKTTERYIRTLPGWLPDGIDTDMNESQKLLFELST